MHKRFDHQAIEKKWQETWKKSGLYDVGRRDQSKEKEYVLVEWPYPSGNLHIGHWYAFAVPDIYVRFKRMQGKQVLFPIGFDAFGLPAENAAIKRGVNPREWTESNIAYMKNQLESMGNAFSWDKTTASIDPLYYKWTQWMFTQFFQNDIAYRGEGVVNWCPGCHTVIANEQVLADGTCERSGDIIEKRTMPQWMLRITDFADALIDDLDTVAWPEHIKEAQRQWIGRSKGAEIEFQINAKINPKILIGTRNPAKFEMLKHTLSFLNDVEFLCLNDVEVDDTLLVEGDDWHENAKLKSEFYFKATGIPTLSSDNVLWLEKWHKDNGVMVHMRKEANSNVERATDEEVIDFLKKWLVTVSGESNANFLYAIAFTNSDGTKSFITKARDYRLQLKVSPHYLSGYPTESFLIDIETGEYKGEQDPAVSYDNLASDLYERADWFQDKVTVFTTRPDTLFGATYLVLAPEHLWVTLATNNEHHVLENKAEVVAYVRQAQAKTEIERGDNTREKTGVELKGVKAINPATGEQIPLFVADYVLAGYGTGAIMAVPAHDERDFAFAQKFGLPITQVVSGDDTVPYTGTGTLVNSGSLNGLSSEEAKIVITEKVGGKLTNTYRLRDWSIGRQRYWGVPIPIVYDPEGTAHAIPKEHLPWILPEDVDVTPTGEPPLAKSKELLERTERIFGAGWRPEVETMDTFVDSSWYYLRYLDNTNSKELASVKAQNDWMQVDTYFGGAEHTTMHLLYSRFWQKALKQLGLAVHSEPYVHRINRGLILGPDGNKMSKSKGNVIDPDEQVKLVGADTVKMYLAFMGPYQGTNYPWDMGGIAGLRRFLERVNGLGEHLTMEEPAATTTLLHKTIKKVGEDIQTLKFNTAISTMMIYVNQAEKTGLTKENYRQLLLILAPFAPHLTAELWQELGASESIHTVDFPRFNPSLATDTEATIGVQINGKLRGEITIKVAAEETEAMKALQAVPVLQERLAGTEIKKVIYVPGKILNIITSG